MVRKENAENNGETSLCYLMSFEIDAQNNKKENIWTRVARNRDGSPGDVIWLGLSQNIHIVPANDKTQKSARQLVK